jgi:hypothetical protein
LFSTEGGQFIGGHGMKQDNKLKTAAGLSDLWDGKPIRRVRSGDGASVMPGRRFSMHIMLQPEVADILFGDNLLDGQGLLSRILVTVPDSAAGSRLWHNERPETDRNLKRYGARLLDILETPLPLAKDKSNELQPRALPLAPEARDYWIRFHDYIEAEIRSDGALEPVRALASKLPEHAARLAAVLTLVSDIETPAVGFEAMRAGIALTEHYAMEALRLAAISRVSHDLRLAKKLLHWLHRKWHESAISLPDLYQRSLNATGDQATAKKIVAILEEHGWLEENPGGAVVAGVRRRNAWRIVT